MCTGDADYFFLESIWWIKKNFNMFIDFRERSGRKERETSMGCLPYLTQLGIQPATQACVLTRELDPWPFGAWEEALMDWATVAQWLGPWWLLLRGDQGGLFSWGNWRKGRKGENSLNTQGKSSQGSGNCKFKGLLQGPCVMHLRKSRWWGGWRRRVMGKDCWGDCTPMSSLTDHVNPSQAKQ